MTRSEILETAKTIVEGHRDNDGRENSFEKIADLWSAYLGVHISAEDVTMLMILLKVSRVNCSHNKEDSLVDIAGYAACAAEYL